MMVDDIFNTIASHMTKGLELHMQLIFAYNFLNLSGYEECQKYHFLEETKNYLDLKKFYSDNYNKLIQEEKLEKIEIIPANWFNHIKQDVDTGTKRSAIKDFMNAWITWEEEVKTFLQICYKQLYEQNEINAALKIADLIKEVSQELEHARKTQINLESSGYDIIYILEIQDSLQKKYNKKIRDDEK